MRLGEIGDHFAVSPERFVSEGDTVVALGHLSWKHKETGASASVEMAHVWTFRDGKAATFRQHTDTARVRELS
jgi:ketosteroid isomerase-like protein